MATHLPTDPLAVVLLLAWVVLTFALPSPNWNGIESYARSFQSIQMLSIIPVRLVAPTLLVLMISIHYYAQEQQRMFRLLGIAFAVIYTAIICVNYYVQLFVVRMNLLHGQLDSLTILALPDLRSVFFALETLGYAFLCCASLAISPIFRGGRLANWIHGLFIVNAALGNLAAIIAPFDVPFLIFAGLGIWMLLFLTALILVGVFFSKAKSRLI